MTQKEQVLQALIQASEPQTAQELANQLQMDRSNVSRYLNEWYKEGMIEKQAGRPVRYTAKLEEEQDETVTDAFHQLVGANDSLKVPIQKAKAAILYPPRGLHTIIFGETGTGKSLFAECMYHFARESGMLPASAPFVAFNCADYAQNPQLLFGHIFGVKKGAFTGADSDQDGLVAQADGGILFLDEIHRLPPEGQEMLFTFIDKGVYRPLGESNDVHHATVQIIGATTEDASTFLETFNRRIPMSIELPPLRQRTLEERYEIVAQFFMDEAKRLDRDIQVNRDVVLAFMLYKAEANIGQVRRDVKLVCAKSFLRYQKDTRVCMKVTQEDLPITVQKGLLDAKQHPQLSGIFEKQWQYLLFHAHSGEVMWDFIDEGVAVEETPFDETTDFISYVTQLAKTETVVDESLYQLSEALYDKAQMALDKTFDKRSRFALALHLQAVLDRLRRHEYIKNDDLNKIRQLYLKEFQVAMELAMMIEEAYHLTIPMEEIGYLTLFLTLDAHPTSEEKATQNVQVIVLMHGEQTATAMLETAQQLLNQDNGYAINMPLSVDVTETYRQLKDYVMQHFEACQSGVLLLTDMGSLNRFGTMLHEELHIPTEALSLTSTMTVMESLRLSQMGRTLEDIYQHLRSSIKTLLFSEETTSAVREKAIIVTCFTGEGVAAQLQEKLKTMISTDEYCIISMQFLEKYSFKRHIDELLSQYDIRAIVGTVEIQYHNIPYFSALDLFEEDKAEMFYRLLDDEVSLDDMIRTLEGTLTHVSSVRELMLRLKETVSKMQQELTLFVEASVESGIMIHLAFLIDHLSQNPDAVQRKFEHLTEFKQENKWAYDIVATQLLSLSQFYHLTLSDDEIAYVTQMFVNNYVDSEVLHS